MKDKVSYAVDCFDVAHWFEVIGFFLSPPTTKTMHALDAVGLASPTWLADFLAALPLVAVQPTPTGADSAGTQGHLPYAA